MWEHRFETAVAAAVFAIFAVMVAAAATYAPEARLVPLVIGIPAALLAGWHLARTVAAHRIDSPAARAGEVRSPLRRDAVALAWIGGFLAAILAGGFVIGGTVGVMISQRFWFNQTPARTAAGGICALVLSHLCFERLLGLVLFRGWVVAWVLG